MDLAFNWQALVFAIVLAVLVSWIAKKRGFFRLPLKREEPLLTIYHLLFAFTLLLVVAFFTGLLHKWLVDRVDKIFLQLSLSFFLFGIYALFFCFLPRLFPRALLCEGALSFQRVRRAALMGIAALCVSYPFVLFVSELVAFLSQWLLGESGVNQVSVNQLKSVVGRPVALMFMLFVVIVIVPCVEELLFRGFLQSYLRQKLGRPVAICISSIVFALAHYASSQGVGNIQLIAALAVLAFFLGWVYEKEQTLIAPIVMHGAFNGLSSLAIIFSV